MRTRRWVLVLSQAVWLLAACGANDESKEGLKTAEIEPAMTARATWRDYPAVQLTNGLVQVSVVPQAGGRVLGFSLGGQPVFYDNPRRAGVLPGEEASRRYPWVPATSTAAPTDGAAEATHETPGRLEPTADQPAASQLPAGSRPEIDDVPGGGEHAADGPLQPTEADDEATPDGAEASATTTEPDLPAAETAQETETATAPDGSPVAAEGGDRGAAEAGPSDGLGDSTTAGAGLTYLPSQTSQDYPNYGGQVSWPLPRLNWPAAWPPPVPVDLGGYAAEVPAHDGDVAEVVLTSPPDDELKVQFTKTVLLRRAASLLQVTTTLRNLDVQSRTWSIADVSQHPGALTPGESFTRDAQLFLPLGPTSALHLGYATLLGSQTNPQLFPDSDQLRLEYLGQESQVATDLAAGWCAWADARHDRILVKLAAQPAEGPYPDDLPITAYTAPAEAESYLQLELRSPLQVVKPQESMEFTVWYGATICPLPIREAGRAGVVNTPLQAEQMADSIRLTGIFGVFCTGFAQVAFVNDEGQELARTNPVDVSPLQPYRLEAVTARPEGATQARLVITDHRRVDLGTLSQVAIIPFRPAPAPELAESPDSPAAPASPTVPVLDLRPSDLPPVSAPMPTTTEVPLGSPGSEPAGE